MAINRKREQLCKDIRITARLHTFEKCRVKNGPKHRHEKQIYERFDAYQMLTLKDKEI